MSPPPDGTHVAHRAWAFDRQSSSPALCRGCPPRRFFAVDIARVTGTGMQTRKYRHAAPCALVGGKMKIIARTKQAYRTAYAALASQAHRARAAAAPRCAAAVAHVQRWSSIAASRLRSARVQVAHQLVQRALHTGDVPSDLDRRAVACRTAMWCFVAMAALVWPILGWKFAVLPLLAALTAGSVATVFWEAAAELEQREHPHWQR